MSDSCNTFTLKRGGGDLSASDLRGAPVAWQSLPVCWTEPHRFHVILPASDTPTRAWQPLPHEFEARQSATRREGHAFEFKAEFDAATYVGGVELDF